MSLCFLPARYPRGSLHARRAGKPLAGKWVACITGLLGDLDYLSLFLRLPRWSSATSPCALCKCTKRGNTTWRNWQQNAGWIATCWKPAEWRLSTERSTSRIFECSGLTAVLVATDWMHAKYLGADQYFSASIMYLLCFVIGEDTPQNNMLQMEAAIKGYYKAHSTRHQYSNLNRLTMFVRKSGPVKLRGKAAEIKCLGEPLLAYWSACCDETNEQHQQILYLLQMSCRCEEILFENKSALAFSHLDYHGRNKFPVSCPLSALHWLSLIKVMKMQQPSKMLSLLMGTWVTYFGATSKRPTWKSKGFSHAPVRHMQFATVHCWASIWTQGLFGVLLEKIWCPLYSSSHKLAQKEIHLCQAQWSL